MTSEAIPTIRFKADSRRRGRLMAEEAKLHPAKMHLGLLDEIVARYGIEPGSCVLDPMGGIGSTALLALYGINVCLVELEEHFCRPALASWEKMRQNPMLGCELGKVLILRGDARALPIASADSIITSPPYEGSLDHDPGNKSDPRGVEWAKTNPHSYTRPVDAVVSSPPYEASLHEGQAGPGATADAKAWAEDRERTRGAYTRPSAIITSPPYEASQTSSGLGSVNKDDWGHEGGNIAKRRSLQVGYTRPDAIVTSPPYGDEREGGDLASDAYIERCLHDGTAAAGQSSNIGNLHGPAYWGAMTAVYQECHRVLKPGGLLILVLKGFTKDGEYQDLPAQTSDLVQSLGFIPFDLWRRELWSLSFWRILQSTDKEETVVAHTRGMFDLDLQEVKQMKRMSNGKLDERLRFEEVHAFKKPLAGGP